MSNDRRTPSPSRRTPSRRTLMIAAILAVIGIAAGVGAVAAGNDEPPPRVLLGTWRPTFIAGFDALDSPRGRPATVTFGEDGQWHGSDGCNGIGGEYEAGAQTISADAGDQTAIGCDNVPNVSVLQRAARWDLTAGTLTLYDKNHTKLATYTRLSPIS